MDPPKKWDSLFQALIFSGSGRLAASLANELFKKPCVVVVGVVIVVFVVAVVTQSGSSGLCSNSPFNASWVVSTPLTNIPNHHLDSPSILFRTPTDRIPNSSDSCGKTFVCHPLPDANQLGSGSPTSKN